MNRFLIFLAGIAVLSAGLTGCRDSEPREPQGKRIRINAPYTDVDVFIPDDEDEDVKVDVEVDD